MVIIFEIPCNAMSNCILVISILLTPVPKYERHRYRHCSKDNLLWYNALGILIIGLDDRARLTIERVQGERTPQVHNRGCLGAHTRNPRTGTITTAQGMKWNWFVQNSGRLFKNTNWRLIKKNLNQKNKATIWCSHHIFFWKSWNKSCF